MTTVSHERQQPAKPPRLCDKPATEPMRLLYQAGLLTAVVIVAYANTLWCGFAWDDEFLVVNNLYLRSWRHVPDIFTNELWEFSQQEPSNFYRPLQTLSHLVEYSLWQLTPLGYHLTNMLLHLGVALAGAILFAVHPIHVETVTYVSSRAHLLAALLTLGAILLWDGEVEREGSRRWTRFAAATVMSALAFLACEAAVAVPLAAGVFLWSSKRWHDWRARLRATAPAVLVFGAVTLVYVVLRFTVVRFAEEALVEPSAPLASRLLSIPLTLSRYLGLLVWPANLSMKRAQIWVTSPTSFGLWGPLFLLACIAGALWLGRRQVPVILAAGWFLAWLAPVLNILPVNGQVVDHWAYLAAMGPIGLAVALGGRVLRSGGRSVPVVAVLACLLTARTIVHNRDFKDSTTLYESALAQNPQDEATLNNLGYLHIEHDPARAERIFRRLVELHPHFAMGYSNLATVLARRRAFDEAEQILKKAIELEPTLVASRLALAGVYQATGRLDLARAEWEQVVRTRPELVLALLQLGLVCEELGDLEAALGYLERASRLQPDTPDIVLARGRLLGSLNRWPEALPVLQRCVTLAPQSPEAHYQLANALSMNGLVRESLEQFRLAINLKSDYVEALNGAAWILATCSDNSIRRGDEAVSLAEQALALTGGDHPGVLDTLAATYASVGRFDQAVKTAERAEELATAGQDAQLAPEIRRRLDGYRQGKPYIESPSTGDGIEPQSRPR